MWRRERGFLPCVKRRRVRIPPLAVSGVMRNIRLAHSHIPRCHTKPLGRVAFLLCGGEKEDSCHTSKDAGCCCSFVICTKRTACYLSARSSARNARYRQVGMRIFVQYKIPALRRKTHNTTFIKKQKASTALCKTVLA